MAVASCWSYMSRNTWFSPGNSESPKPASRMHLIIICANWLSSLRATSWMRALSGVPLASARGRAGFNVPMGMLAMAVRGRY